MYTSGFAGFMKGMDFFLRFQRSYDDFIAKNESLRKKLEDVEAALARLQESHAPKEIKLSLLGEWIASLVAELDKSKSVAQARISDLEIKLTVDNVISKSVIKDHLAIHEELTFAKGEANL